MNPADLWPHVCGSEDRHGVLYDLGVLKGSPWYKPRDRRRGLLVDSACSQLALGKPIPDKWWQLVSGIEYRNGGWQRGDDVVPHEECRPYVEAFQRVLAITDAKDIQVQVPVIHKGLMYQGTADLLLTIDGRRKCWDTKCGEPQPWHILQLAAYIDASFESAEDDCDGANVYLPSGKIVEYPRDDMYAALKEFRHLARCWHIVNKYGGFEE